MTDERITSAAAGYDRFVFSADLEALTTADRDLDGVEADLALARGKLLHARFLAGGAEDPQELPLFQRAADLYQALGDTRGEAEALCWIGILHQVVRHDDAAARPALHRSAELAQDDRLTLSYALRHLGIAEHSAGRLGAARAQLEQSTRLRRELGFPAGVAANLVGLIYIAAAEGRPSDAAALADEAQAIAAGCGATSVLRQIEEAREISRR